jgi:hypothetical protein
MKLATEKKYLKMLNEMYEILQITDRINMSDFVQKWKVTKSLSKVMQSGGLIKRSGSKLNSTWQWTSIKPNVFMVQELIKRISKETSQDYRDGKPLTQIHKPKRKYKNTQVVVDPIIEPKKRGAYKPRKSKVFSLFWGLIKFNY